MKEILQIAFQIIPLVMSGGVSVAFILLLFMQYSQIAKMFSNPTSNDFPENRVLANATVLEMNGDLLSFDKVQNTYNFVLEVRPPHAPPFTIRTSQVIYRTNITQVMEGCIVPVMYDPQNPAQIVFVFSMPRKAYYQAMERGYYPE
jgi:hypothetical protein